MSLFGSGRREGLLAVLTLLLLSIALHAPSLFLGERRVAEPTSAQKEFGRREAHTNDRQLLPAMQAAGRVAAAGELPLWNPTARLGEPFLVSGGGVLYPPFWLLMQDGSHALLDLLLCLHSFLAAMGMYRFCRAMPLSRYAAFCAGAMYGLGWVFNAQLDRLPHAAAAALLPLAMEAAWRLLVHRRRQFWAVTLAAYVGLMFFTGGISVAVLGTFLCVALFVYGFWALDNDARVLALRAAGLAGVLCLLATAPIWIHWWSHAGALQAAEQRSPGHLQLVGLMGFLSPELFGGLGPAPASLLTANPDADPLELVLYPGAMALFLVTLWVLRPKRSIQGLFWVPLGGLGILMALDTPLQDRLADFYWWAPAVPGISLLLANVAIVVLAAIALENFFEAPLARPKAMFANSLIWVLALLALLGLGFVFTGPGTEAISRMLDSSNSAEIEAVLRRFTLHLLPSIGLGALIGILFIYWRKLGIMRFKGALATVMIAELLVIGIGLTPRDKAPERDSLIQNRIPTTAGRAIAAGRSKPVSLAGLQGGGIGSISTEGPAILSRTAEYLGCIDKSLVQVGAHARVLPLRSVRQLSDRRLQLAGVGAAISADSQLTPGFQFMSPVPGPETHSEHAVHVLLRETSAARVRMMFQEHWAASHEEAIKVLEHMGNEVLETVILEGEPDEFRCKRPAAPVRVQIVADRANELEIEVDVGQGRGYLLVADAYAEGWTASIDGEPCRILPAQVGMRAVAIPEGQHRIRMVYRPSILVLGIPLGILGVMLLVGFTAISLWRRRRDLGEAD